MREKARKDEEGMKEREKKGEGEGAEEGRKK